MKHAAFATDTTAYMPAVPAGINTAHLSALGLDLVDASQTQAIAALLAPGRRRAYFMNAHCCNIRRRDTAYAQAVATADMLLPDGIGVELAGRMTGKRLAANLNGTDLLPAMLAQAASMGKSVYLFGGTPGTAQAAANRLVNTIPDLRIVSTRDGCRRCGHRRGDPRHQRQRRRHRAGGAGCPDARAVVARKRPPDRRTADAGRGRAVRLSGRHRRPRPQGRPPRAP